MLFMRKSLRDGRALGAIGEGSTTLSSLSLRPMAGELTTGIEAPESSAVRKADKFVSGALVITVSLLLFLVWYSGSPERCAAAPSGATTGRDLRRSARYGWFSCQSIERLKLTPDEGGFPRDAQPVRYRLTVGLEERAETPCDLMGVAHERGTVDRRQLDRTSVGIAHEGGIGHGFTSSCTLGNITNLQFGYNTQRWGIQWN
jgi:hypothetical protein